MRTVVFEGLGEHLFEDDRAQLKSAGKQHPLDNPAHQGAKVLLVNHNFGCGSSREHAPQAILRWGIEAMVGESFAEIFDGNCVAIGLPCCRVSHATAEALMAQAEAVPQGLVEVDLAQRTLRAGHGIHSFAMPEGMRQQLLTGRWDTTQELLEATDLVRARAAELGYFRSFVG